MSITHYNPEDIQDRTALATALERMLVQEAHFEKVSSLTEDIYEFRIKQVPGVRVVVFSSVINGVARGNGEDAIRVAIMYRRQDGKDQFILSETRVNRTGAIAAIVQRTLGRMRDAFKAFRERDLKGMRCAKCNAPLFHSLKGNEVCAETCWIKK